MPTLLEILEIETVELTSSFLSLWYKLLRYLSSFLLTTEGMMAVAIIPSVVLIPSVALIYPPLWTIMAPSECQILTVKPCSLATFRKFAFA